jgi:quinol-cytochrome oxidoreductase complex cytochrome b subunit/coenzyme F420-reducing hydrogenase delta subunit/Pyruvate/2-oxoacid:ferredoxin oxidoreductase delta subunit
MIERIHRTGRALFGVLRRPMARAFESAENPLNHIGAMTVFFLWIVLISGIWLLIFFRTSISGAFESVEYLTREQWYLGGIMRSLHRYASDAAIVTILLHIVKEFVFNRYRSNRWFTWVTGVPLVWMIFVLGVTGYWLVWDELAQYVAISSAELIDAIPIFTDSMAGNFLSDDLLSNRFFTLMAFLHLIGLPIFLVFGIWLHIFRLTGPRINPPRRMMAATLLAMLVLSAVYPAISHEQANLAMTPQVLRLDWFYLHVYPLIQIWSPGWVWALLVGVSSVIVIAPWGPPQKKELPALVTLEYCNGCERCVDDCPFGAVEMVPRTDDTSYSHQASVDPDLCVSCGICVGSCPTATPFRSRGILAPGIDLPDRSAAAMREDIVAAGAGKTSPHVIVFGCRDDSQLDEIAKAGISHVKLNCMGQLPPSYVDFALSRGHADGVLLLGCQDGNCSYRFGAMWTEQRLARERDPMVRRRVDMSKVAIGWQAPWSDSASALKKLEAFKRALEE